MKTQFIINAQRAFLEDNAKHFNEGNRAVKEDGSCVYSPTPTSEGCAIGRNIVNKLICKDLDDTKGAVNSNAIWEKMPGEIKILGREFLSDVQRLHDSGGRHPIFWDSNGLNDKGLWRYNNILRDINKGCYI